MLKHVQCFRMIYVCAEPSGTALQVLAQMEGLQEELTAKTHETERLKQVCRFCMVTLCKMMTVKITSSSSNDFSANN